MPSGRRAARAVAPVVVAPAVGAASLAAATPTVDVARAVPAVLPVARAVARAEAARHRAVARAASGARKRPDIGIPNGGRCFEQSALPPAAERGDQDVEPAELARDAVANPYRSVNRADVAGEGHEPLGTLRFRRYVAAKAIETYVSPRTLYQTSERMLPSSLKISFTTSWNGVLV